MAVEATPRRALTVCLPDVGKNLPYGCPAEAMDSGVHLDHAGDMTTTREREAGGVAVLTRTGGRETPVVTTADGPPSDIVDQWGVQSFPASDPPANW
jgi:hypothetical protein